MSASVSGFRVVIGAFVTFLVLLAGIGWASYAGANAAVDAATTRLTVHIVEAGGRALDVRLTNVSCTVRHGRISIRNSPGGIAAAQILADSAERSTAYGVSIRAPEVAFTTLAAFGMRDGAVRFDRLPGTAMLTADGPPESYRATLDGSIPCDGA